MCVCVWLINLHVVVCVCLYGLYRDDMSQGSTEYWVASSAVHPSKTLDFGHLERSHMAASASWAGRNDDDHYMSWVLKLQVASVIQIHCRYVPDSTLRHIETIHVWISASNLAGLVFHGFLSRELLMSFRLLVLKPWLSVFELGHQMQQNIMGRSLSPHAGFIVKSWLLHIVTICYYTSILDHLAGWKFRKSAMARFRSKGPTCSDAEELLAYHRSMWCQGTSKVGLPGVSCQRLDERASFCLTVHFCWKLILKPVAKLKRSLADHMQVSSRSAKFWTNFNQNKQKCASS